MPTTRPRTASLQVPEDPYSFATQVKAHFVTQAERPARHWQYGMVGMAGLAALLGGREPFVQHFRWRGSDAISQ